MSDTKYFQTLLGDRVFPILEDLAFVHADRDSAVEGWLNFEGKLLRQHGIEMSSRIVHGSLEQVVRQLDPLSMPTRERYLFIPCRDGWTLVLDNGRIGSDAHSLLYGTVSRTKQTGVRLCVSAPVNKQTGKQRILSVMWEVWQPSSNGIDAKAVRALAVLKEGSWRWDNMGAPLPFEETAAFAAKRIPDRFTPQMLERYAKAMGIDAFNEDFYLTQDPGAVLLQLSHVPFLRHTRSSLEEVQRDWRWYDER